jgi:hypothetical protein
MTPHISQEERTAMIGRIHTSEGQSDAYGCRGHEVQWSDTTYKLAPDPYDCIGGSAEDPPPMQPPGAFRTLRTWDAPTPAAHECDACGAEASRFWHGGGLWVCVDCDWPSYGPYPYNISLTESQLWAALIRVNAGLRVLQRLQGEAVNRWFLIRFRRLQRAIQLRA